MIREIFRNTLSWYGQRMKDYKIQNREIIWNPPDKEDEVDPKIVV